MRFSPDLIRALRETTVQQTQQAIRRRLDALGLYRSTVQIEGGGAKNIQDQLVVEFPPVDNPERVMELITSVASLELKFVKQEQGGPFTSVESAIQANGGHIPDGYQICPHRADKGGDISYLLVKTASTIDGSHLKRARRSTDASGRPAVDFTLTQSGADLFSRATEQHIGDRLAIVIDNTVISAPVIQTRIGAEAVITGAFTVQEAEDLALLLRSGALPAALTVLESRKIGGPAENGSTNSDKK